MAHTFPKLHGILLPSIVHKYSTVYLNVLSFPDEYVKNPRNHLFGDDHRGRRLVNAWAFRIAHGHAKKIWYMHRYTISVLRRRRWKEKQMYITVCYIHIIGCMGGLQVFGEEIEETSAANWKWISINSIAAWSSNQLVGATSRPRMWWWHTQMLGAFQIPVG